MNLFGIVLADVIFVIAPLLLYLFYLIFERNIERKENNLFFDIALLSSLYLLIKFSPSRGINATIVLLNIPLLIAYMKKRNIMIIFISLIIVLFSNVDLGLSWFYFIIQYIIYYLIYLFMHYKKKDRKYFIGTFILLKTIVFFSTCIIIYRFSFEKFGMWMIVYSIFMLCLTFSLLMFSKCEEISRYFINKQHQEQEKKIKSSLFRITHEIKNPIAVCKGYLDMFDVDNEEHSKKYIPIMREEIERTLMLLQDFLSISKPKIEKDYMDVNMLVEEVASNFNLMMKERNIKQKLNLIDEDIYIMGDYNRLTQVLINLLKNSMEAIPKNKDGIIKITTNILDQKCYIEIEDNGEGITEEVLKKIQEPFFTTKVNGTGLGVSLSREIVKAHDGLLIYDSTPLVGTTVKIWLPIEN